MSYGRQALKLAAGIAVTFIACGCRTTDSGTSALRETDIASAAGPLSAQQWIDHYRNDLLPFWSSVEAQGTPVGNFPTFRCNDGSLFNAAHPCVELSESEDWIRTELGRDYVRMQSRQAFFYGVGFNITGDPKLLALAKAGVDYIRQHAIRADGSVVAYWQAGKADNLGNAATSQDAAYTLMGLSFYYYLTRDPDVLTDILRIKNHVFTKFFQADGFGPGLGLMHWDGQTINPVVQDLTAHLDQLNAYMVLLAPLLTGETQTAWHAQMSQLVDSLRQKFFDPNSQMFRSQLQDPTTSLPGWAHMDFGHTVKTFWMMDLIAKQNHDDELETYAREGIKNTIKTAYLGKDPAGRALGFASRPHLWEGIPPHAAQAPVNCPPFIDRSLNCEQEWWIFAELDQAGATLALKDHDLGTLIDETNRYWLSQFVDPSGKEVWQMLSSPYGASKYPKAHLWKSGFHSSEHVLVGYLTANWRTNQLAPLYFAWANPDGVKSIPAYMFQAEVARIESVTGSHQAIQRVLFRSPL